MFSCSLGRAVRTVPASAITSRAANSASSITAIRPLTQCTRQRQPNHQRRHSSSKTSIPPDGSKVVAPAQRAAATGRATKKKSKDAATPADTQNLPFSKQYPNLPSVPTTHHLQPKDINISSFFSLHRPISVTTPIPPPTTEAQFNSIFEPRIVNNSEKFAKVISTLGGFTENLESAAEADEDGNITWQMIEASSQEETRKPEPRELKTPLQTYMSQSQFRPFRLPPFPQPLNELSSTPSKSKSKRASVAPQKGRSWSTTITITEYTNPDGKVMYANAIADPVAITPSTPQVRQPFLHRMQERERSWLEYRDERSQQRAPSKKPDMRLISVKRQRKLKMKKHKYKKLMKRTRNERRKLGKL